MIRLWCVFGVIEASGLTVAYPDSVNGREQLEHSPYHLVFQGENTFTRLYNKIMVSKLILNIINI